MSTWWTWLLIRDLDPSLQGWARSAALLDRSDLSARPAVSLAWENGAAVMRTPSKSKLFSYLFRTAPLQAFSTAAREDLPFLDGKEFFFESVRYRLFRIRRHLNVREPYDERLFRIERVGSADIQRDQQTGQAELRDESPHDGSVLFLDPVQVELTQAQAEDLFSGLEPGRAYADIGGGCFLPPVRSRTHSDIVGSYFSDAALRLRVELRDSAALLAPRIDEPLAVHLTRITDEPMLRDILLEGGSLHVIREEGQPTRVDLHVQQRGSQLATVRERVIFEHALTGPEWSLHVAKALREDIAGHVSVVARAMSDQSSSWRLEAEPSNNPKTWEGTWHTLFRQVLPRLDQGHPASAEHLRTAILDPSHSIRAHTFDHSHAERLFMAHAWRCPWPATEAELTAWQRALLELLSGELVGQPQSPDQRLAIWNQEVSGDRYRGRAFHSAGTHAPHLHVRYMGDPDDNDVLFRRLLLPLGTVLNARTIYLDKGARSRLDNGLVLA